MVAAKKVLLADAPLCVIIIDSKETKRGVQSNVDIFLAQNGGHPPGDFASYRISDRAQYNALRDEFGPMNMFSIIKFVKFLDNEIGMAEKDGKRRLVLSADAGRRNLTNAAFLLGSYIILKYQSLPEKLSSYFEKFDPRLFEGYRDATNSIADFRLSLLDCWRGLWKGMALGWISMPNETAPYKWGHIDKDLYELYANPLNADLHEVVPRRFVAFRGPKDLKGQLYRDNYQNKSREFDASYYLEIFEDLHVSSVVRLNEAVYPSHTYSDHGIDHHDLYFDDCSAPPPHVVRAFFAIVDCSKGAVAIHCKAGLGRTGTMIAMYLMRTHGFSARDAMAWLRIMRPGSVIGVQQHFLCRVQESAEADPTYWHHCDVTQTAATLALPGTAAALATSRSILTATAAMRTSAHGGNHPALQVGDPASLRALATTAGPGSASHGATAGGDSDTVQPARRTGSAPPTPVPQPQEPDASPPPPLPSRLQWPGSAAAAQLVSIFSRRLPGPGGAPRLTADSDNHRNMKATGLPTRPKGEGAANDGTAQGDSDRGCPPQRAGSGHSCSSLRQPRHSFESPASVRAGADVPAAGVEEAAAGPRGCVRQAHLKRCELAAVERLGGPPVGRGGGASVSMV